MIAEADRRFVEEVRDKFLTENGARIRKVILFGSRATGAARADSDFDFLIVESGPVAKREEALRLRRTLGDLPYPVDVRVMSEEEFEETKLVVGGLAYPAHKHGVVLYENA